MDFTADGRDRYRTLQHMDFNADELDRYRTVQHMDIIVGIRTIARTDTIPKDTIPKDIFPNEHDPEWTQSRTSFYIVTEV